MHSTDCLLESGLIAMTFNGCSGSNAYNGKDVVVNDSIQNAKERTRAVDRAWRSLR